MSVSAIGPAAPAPLSGTRAPDGDFKKPGLASGQVKDADGDYKPAAASPAASSSSATQTALTLLKNGG